MRRSGRGAIPRGKNGACFSSVRAAVALVTRKSELQEARFGLPNPTTRSRRVRRAEHTVPVVSGRTALAANREHVVEMAVSRKRGKRSVADVRSACPDDSGLRRRTPLTRTGHCVLATEPLPRLSPSRQPGTGSLPMCSGLGHSSPGPRKAASTGPEGKPAQPATRPRGGSWP